MKESPLWQVPAGRFIQAYYTIYVPAVVISVYIAGSHRWLFQRVSAEVNLPADPFTAGNDKRCEPLCIWWQGTCCLTYSLWTNTGTYFSPDYPNYSHPSLHNLVQHRRTGLMLISAHEKGRSMLKRFHITGKPSASLPKGQNRSTSPLPRICFYGELKARK